MEEIGTVVEIKEQKAIITVNRKSGCGSCPGGSVCNLTDIEARIEAINNINAKVGDTVKISFKTNTYLKATICVYGMPSIMLIIGAIIGKEYLSKLFLTYDPDLVSAISGFGFFVFSFILVKILSKRYEGKKEYIPIIEEIVPCKGKD